MMIYIGFDVGEMVPTKMVLEQKNLDVKEVQGLLAQGALTPRCFGRHQPLLDILLEKTGISIAAKVTERIQYLVAGDQYLEIKISEGVVSFHLFKITSPN